MAYDKKSSERVNDIALGREGTEAHVGLSGQCPAR
jgi:hypothetical protein